MICIFWKNGYEFNEKIVEQIPGKSAQEYLTFLRKYIEKNLNNNNVLRGSEEFLSKEKKIGLRII